MNPLIPFACISSSVGAIPGMRVSALGVHRLPSTVAGVEVTWWRRDWHFWGYWTAAIWCKSGEKVSVYVCPWHEVDTTLFVRPKETFPFFSPSISHYNNRVSSLRSSFASFGAHVLHDKGSEEICRYLPGFFHIHLYTQGVHLWMLYLCMYIRRRYINEYT